MSADRRSTLQLRAIRAAIGHLPGVEERRRTGTTPGEIVRSLRPTTWVDNRAEFDRKYPSDSDGFSYMIPSVEAYRERFIPHGESRTLTKRVIGTTGSLPRGAVIELDETQLEDGTQLYRIRVRDEEIVFTRENPVIGKPTSEDYTQIIAGGVSLLVNQVPTESNKEKASASSEI